MNKTKKSDVVKGLVKIYNDGIKEIEKRCNDFLKENDMWYGDARWCVSGTNGKLNIRENDRNGDQFVADGVYDFNTTWIKNRNDVEKFIKEKSEIDNVEFKMKKK